MNSQKNTNDCRGENNILNNCNNIELCKSSKSTPQRHNKRLRVIMPDATLSSDNLNKKIKTNSETRKQNEQISKQEASARRKEQRRIRNRISAAASRQKVKNRIEELEKQVCIVQAKYNFVLDRLKKYEPSFTDEDTERLALASSKNVSLVSPCMSPSLLECNDAVMQSYTFPLLNAKTKPHRVEENEGISEQCNDKSVSDILNTSDEDQELEEFLKDAFDDDKIQ